MTETLKSQLAAALTTQTDRTITESDILDYRPARDGGYNVVLTNYQKFRNIQPIDAAEAPREPSNIPTHLHDAYQNPSLARKAEVQELCDVLGIPYLPKTTKKELAKSVSAWKKNTAPVPKPEAADSSESANPVAKPGHMQAHDVTQWSEEEE